MGWKELLSCFSKRPLAHISTDQGAEKGCWLSAFSSSPFIQFRAPVCGILLPTVGEALSQMHPKVYPTNTLGIS